MGLAVENGQVLPLGWFAGIAKIGACQWQTAHQNPVKMPAQNHDGVAGIPPSAHPAFSLVPETIFHPFVNVLKFIHYAQVALPIFKIHRIF